MTNSATATQKNTEILSSTTASSAKKLIAARELRLDTSATAKMREYAHDIYSALMQEKTRDALMSESAKSDLSYDLVLELLASKSGRNTLVQAANAAFDIVRHKVAQQNKVEDFQELIDSLRANNAKKTEINSLLSIKIGGKVGKSGQIVINTLHQNLKRHLKRASEELFTSDAGTTYYSVIARKAADHDEKVLSVYQDDLVKEFVETKKSGKAFDPASIIEMIDKLKKENAQALTEALKTHVRDNKGSNWAVMFDAIEFSNTKGLAGAKTGVDVDATIDEVAKKRSKRAKKVSANKIELEATAY